MGDSGDAKTRPADAGYQGIVRNEESQAREHTIEEAPDNTPDNAPDDRHGSRDSPVVLVDDLAAAGDYWLTITDAARVTRRQEITIRRWISAGALPVRRQRMGLNKRTRHVRASDLARLTPIIDPTATISGAPANADLLSIPIQQAQLLTAQQALVQRLIRCEQTLADLTAQREADHQVLEQQNSRLDASTQATAALRVDVQGEIRAVREATQSEMEGLRQGTTALTSLAQRVESGLHNVAGELAQERAERERGHTELVAGLTVQAAAMHQLDVVAKQVQAELAQAEQEKREWQHRLTDAVAQLRDQQRLTTALSDELTAARQAQQDWQRQISALQNHVAALQTDLLAQLQGERHRRRMLEQQVHALRAFRHQWVRRHHKRSHAEDAAERR
jgi:hypothetical protein